MKKAAAQGLVAGLMRHDAHRGNLGCRSRSRRQSFIGGWWTIWSRVESQSHTHVHIALRVPPVVASGQCGPASDAVGPVARMLDLRAKSGSPNSRRQWCSTPAAESDCHGSASWQPRSALTLNADVRKRSAFEVLSYPDLAIETLAPVIPEILIVSLPSPNDRRR